MPTPLRSMTGFALVMMRITASKLRQQCLTLLDKLEPGGIIVTKLGKPVARLVPLPSDCASLIGSMKSRIQVHGDIFSTGMTWEAAASGKKR